MAAPNTIPKSFSPLAIWAMSFGCCVGWGAFVLPGSMFLPLAGPLGSILALFLGALAMIVIGANYHFMAQRFPDNGGAFSYVRNILGFDHAFLCSWFLWLVYAAIIWANASAFTLIVRNFFGNFLQFGLLYTLVGYNIYLGEILFTSLSLVAVGLLCMYANRAAILLNIFLAFLLLIGISLCFIFCYGGLSEPSLLNPPFVPQKNLAFQIFNILALSPWAFVGFESVSQVTEEISCKPKKLFSLMALGLLTASLVYALFILIACMPIDNAMDWATYAQKLITRDPLDPPLEMVGFPVLQVVSKNLGSTGVFILGLAILGAVGTGIIGFFLALSRLTCRVAEEKILPLWFSQRDEQNRPFNAALFVMLVSLIIPFIGRTAIIWIVDIASICATIAYTYISYCAYKQAKLEGKNLFKITGIIGTFLGIAFCLFTSMPNIWSISSLSSESYFIFSLWGILGFVFYLYVFKRDKEEKYGRSTFVWLTMLFFIFVSSLMWMRQEAHESTAYIMKEAQDYYHHKLETLAPGKFEAKKEAAAENAFISERLAVFNKRLIKHSLIQMLLITVSIGVVFGAYSLMQTRKRRVELEKIKAEEISKSKSAFLSSMSHDIRTPMNAIIGFTDLALTKIDTTIIHEYLQKIKLSSNHLLSLINDVLEMSRIESGKVELHPIPVSIPELLHDLNTIIIGQVESKQHTLDINAINVKNENILCDKLRINQILLNLLSNAIKYTPSCGRISVNLTQTGVEEDFASYQISVKDNGLGMSQEFAARIFEAFSRENTSKIDKIQGTGLGMAITKHLVDLMGGSIKVLTEKDKGTEFILNFQFPILNSDVKLSIPESVTGLHILVVDDDYTACESITEMLTDFGARAEWTLSSNEAILRYTSALKRDDPFKLCIIDWKMPDTSGVNVARKIMEVSRDFKPNIILVTAYDWQNIRDEAIQAGVKVFCNKPVFPSELRASVLAAIGVKDEMANPKEEKKPFDFRDKRILLVDDLEVNREIAMAILNLNGLEVEEACDGVEALEKVQNSEAGYFDVVLMDVQMPNMNGYEATKAIRKLSDPKKAQIPILAMTANAFDEDKKAALDAGMNGHLTKPIDIEKLLAALQEIF
ncbi:MAG: amino acid permease [Desulfovibrionaceae bacterium]|nr:amino acid permease [Desulfovibrionaceae bacterium]